MLGKASMVLPFRRSFCPQRNVGPHTQTEPLGLFMGSFEDQGQVPDPY